MWLRRGIEGALVSVEPDLVQGLPLVMFSGLPDAACRQAPDRIKASAANSDVPIPNRRLTVNLSPASIPKVGSGWALLIAIAVLAAADVFPAGARRRDRARRRAGPGRPDPPVRRASRCAGRSAAGQVTDRGSCRERGRGRACPRCLCRSCPSPARSRAVLPGHRARVKNHRGWSSSPHSCPMLLRCQICVMWSGGTRGVWPWRLPQRAAITGSGPPGAGKTMLSERLPSLLPDLEPAQTLEVTAIRSVLGALPASGALLVRPPFVASHHGAAMPAIIDGSGFIRPGGHLEDPS